MLRMPTIEQIVQSIDTRINELLAEQGQLADARAALSGSSRETTPPLNPTRTRTRRSRPRSRAKAIALDELVKLVTDKPGQTSTSLATIANANQTKLLASLKEAETHGTVRREGQRRATRWYPYTDEDRIAERAAELTKQSGKQTP
jgi:hypothetical protein